MPVKYIVDKIKDWKQWQGIRYRRLDVLQRFMESTIYDHLEYPFYTEIRDSGEYIPLRDRRPSVIYNLAKVVVSRSTSLLFADKHWPKLNPTDKTVFDFLQQTVNQTALQAYMLEASKWGSLGSVAVMFSLINGKFFYEVWNPKYCMPKFGPDRDLEELFIMYPTPGFELAAVGFQIEDEFLEETYLFAKKFTKNEEIIYTPIKEDEFEKRSDFTEDKERSEQHKLGFVPGVWIKNFPTSSGLDAESTFGQILHFCVEIDYQLSQCGRGLKYNSDPQLLIKEPPGGNEAQLGLFADSQPRVRSTSNALFVGPEGDAKLLEITGQGQKAVIEFVKALRQYALEVARGSRKDPEHAYGNMSGRAMEILDEDLIALAAVFRLSYGDEGLRPLCLKMLRAAKKLGMLDVDVDAKDFAIKLEWGNWFDPTPTDLFQTEQALDLAVIGRRMYQSEARMVATALWGVGHAEPEELNKEYPIPPEPELPELAIAKAKAAKGPGGSSADHVSRQGNNGAGA